MTSDEPDAPPSDDNFSDDEVNDTEERYGEDECPA